LPYGFLVVRSVCDEDCVEKQRKRGVSICSSSLIWIDWVFVFGNHFFAFSPLPVGVAVVVDFLDRDRRFSGHIIREIVWSPCNLVIFRLRIEAGFSGFVLG